MTIWLPDLTAFDGPRYQAIVAALDRAIREGALAAGARLPPVRELAFRLGVTSGTVSRAYQLAEARGLVSGEVGRGTYVRATPVATPAPATPVADEAEGPVQLHRNIPVGHDAGEAIAAALGKVMAQAERSNAFALGLTRVYEAPEGARRHREAGARWVARVGVEAAADEVVAGLGAQHALVMALSVLARPGETVLAEAMAYAGFSEAARFLHLETEGVAFDALGMLPEALEEAAARTGARVVFLVPTCSNPTASTMDLDRRQALVEVARRRDLMLIEDDVYGFLPRHRPPALRTLAPERVFYIASGSKCLAPGLRTAWTVAPRRFVEELADNNHALLVAPPTLPFEIVANWIEDGTADRLIESQRLEVASRREIALQCLTGLDVTLPEGCLHGFLRLPAPWRAQDFASAALRRGAVVRPANAFAVGRAEVPHAVRFSIGQPAGREALAEGLRIIAEVARDAPKRRDLI